MTETDDIMNRWKEYCGEMFKEDGIPTDNDTNTGRGDDDGDLEPLRKIETAIKSQRDGKSPGCDGIPAEMIKAAGEEGVRVYLSLCRKIWNSGQWPRDWKRAVFMPLPKKGDLQECSNYRTISLISHASKIMLKVIQCRQ